MHIDQSIFKGYDIRGIYPQDLNEENIVAIIKAIFLFLSEDNPQLKIALGRDMRLSSPSLFQKAKETLVALGAQVIDLGLLSTPTLYFSVFHYGYDAGIQISASHNPKEWNGIKIVKNSPKGLIKIGKTTGLEQIKELALKGLETYMVSPGSVVEKKGILEDEVENALKIVGSVNVKKFKIVADAANAMGGQYINALFEKIPADLVRMNFMLDGNFPSHQPDPLQKETLIDLQKKVVDEKADVGLAPDGDGDRLFFIDEKGQVIPPTVITSIVARELLKTHPHETFYIDIRYILTPYQMIATHDARVIVTKVGHAFITEAMHASGGIFAGESSGHYFFRETGNAENQLPVILIVLKVLTEMNKPLSQIVEEYRKSFESGEINFTVSNAKDILQAIKEGFGNGKINELDGVAVDFPDWRFSLRTSNTEPLLRLNVEAFEKETMEKKRDDVIAFIKSHAK